LETHNVSCLYCGNPRPELSFRTQSKKHTAFFLPKIFTYQQESVQDIQRTPFVFCQLCGREYFLFATRNELEFIDDFLKNFVMYTDDFVNGLRYYELSIENLAMYIVGIAQPIKSKGEIHLVVNHPNGRYYIRCVKEEGAYLAINMEKVGII
jgi:hypothetical protein